MAKPRRPASCSRLSRVSSSAPRLPTTLGSLRDRRTSGTAQSSSRIVGGTCSKERMLQQSTKEQQTLSSGGRALLQATALAHCCSPTACSQFRSQWVYYLAIYLHECQSSTASQSYCRNSNFIEGQNWCSRAASAF
jgi:hypothetical protein